MVRDRWEVGGAYEAYVGRWSRAVARDFVRWADVPPGRRWLDVGCGTGALTAAVVAGAAPARVVGVDPSRGFLRDAAGLRAAGDARALPVRDRSFDAVVSGLALNFVPEPPVAVAELARAAAPGGVVAAYVWDYAEGMTMMRHVWDAAVALDPAAWARDEAIRFAMCRPGPLRELWAAAGLAEVSTRAIDIPTVFADFDDFWRPFLGGQGAAPAYVMSLPEDRRAALRDRVRAGLPTAAGGSIALTARAWAVRGVHPPA
ncbi:class I SAM-dependent methyltransferase [Jidongwangia harbinensis]|uniref:class I SAM-dependent methyltransferase n=1 Tax=Jidongwangia harbinensis TaxID=2878561 RepID=UPI001CD91881|nr:class I SAM-dependent methyltransferase [Jidongwangia harbinensis]MCA2219135.1 class I SAM-dependent methyltransferase [Jidongwangia harbinensis]